MTKYGSNCGPSIIVSHGSFPWKWGTSSTRALTKVHTNFKTTTSNAVKSCTHIYIYIIQILSVCLSVCVCVCLSSIGGQTTGPIMTKFGTHMRIDLGMVPTKNWPHEWPGSVESLGPISESGLSCQLLLRAVVWQMTSQ